MVLWSCLIEFLARLIAFGRARWLVWRFVPHLRGESVLDLGCGTGHLGAVLSGEYQKSVTLLDIEPRAGQLGQRLVAIPCARALANRYGLDYYLYDGNVIPLNDHSIDVVLLAFVLHHAQKPEMLLNEAFRVARKQVIILEDIPESSFNSFGNKILDAIVNLEFCDHPHGVKSRDEWLLLFHNLDGKVVVEDKWTYWMYGVLPFPNAMFVIDKK